MAETTSLSPATSPSAEERPTSSAHLEISVQAIEVVVSAAEERPTSFAHLEISVQPIEVVVSAVEAPHRQ
jgi:hypothetical protein